jgi:L-alanine-DL-glutamate epimerase-like enolase superfamily enzyme
MLGMIEQSTQEIRTMDREVERLSTVIELPAMADAITRGASSRLRCDPSDAGGISAARSAMVLACAHGLKTELQSYGYPLNQAANLHLMLGVKGCWLVIDTETT